MSYAWCTSEGFYLVQRLLREDVPPLSLYEKIKLFGELFIKIIKKASLFNLNFNLCLFALYYVLKFKRRI